MIVTSFSQKGYHEYGKRFIETFLDHWKDETLVVYFEKGIPTSKPKSDRVKYVNLYQFPEFKQFEETLAASDPMFRGVMRTPEGKKAYNFRFDVLRFFRKVFCVHHATLSEMCQLWRLDDDRVAWVDADVYFHKDIPAGFLKELCPDDVYIAHLAREWLYTETGFVVYNVKHEANSTFQNLYLSTYFNGAFKLLGEWHDCYALDYLIKLLHVPTNDLNPHKKSNHPFNDSILGKYMDHMKGPERKKQGKSHEHELQQKSA